MSAAGRLLPPEWSCCTPVGSTRTESLWLGVLHAGDGAVLSHLTAAKRAGLRWTGDDVVHVMTPRGDAVLPLPGYRFHQTRRPYERWVKPVTGPPRLPLEHAALLAAERDHNVRRAIGLLAACVQQQLTTAERFGRAIPHIRKLRHGMTFRLVLDDIAGGAQSFAELDVGRLCAEYGLLPPTGKSYGSTSRVAAATSTASGSWPTGASSCSRWTARSTPRSSRGGPT